MSKEFWKEKPLSELSLDEWESLCDGCGKCCLHKLEDEDTGEVCYTNVACRLMDTSNCQCTKYQMRTFLVPDCVELLPQNLDNLHWLPSSCAYRILRDGEDLPDWHPLVTGDPESTVKSGNSVAGRIVSEDDADDLEDHIVHWPE